MWGHGGCIGRVHASNAKRQKVKKTVSAANSFRHNIKNLSEKKEKVIGEKL